MFQLVATSTSASNSWFVLPNTTSTFIKKNVIKLSEWSDSTIHTAVSSVCHKCPLTDTTTELSFSTYCTLCEGQQQTDICKWLTWYIRFTLNIQVFWDVPLCCCASSSPYFEGTTTAHQMTWHHSPADFNLQQCWWLLWEPQNLHTFLTAETSKSSVSSMSQSMFQSFSPDCFVHWQTWVRWNVELPAQFTHRTEVYRTAQVACHSY